MTVALFFLPCCCMCPNTLAAHCVSERHFDTLEVNALDRMKEQKRHNYAKAHYKVAQVNYLRGRKTPLSLFLYLALTQGRCWLQSIPAGPDVRSRSRCGQSVRMLQSHHFIETNVNLLLLGGVSQC